MTLLTRVLAAFAFVIGSTLPFACTGESRPLLDVPTYRNGVGGILDAKCARCHAGDAPAAGFRVDRYRGTIGCTSSGERVDLARTLDRTDHRGFVTDEERATLVLWAATGTQSVRSGVHPPGFADPRLPTGHAAVLRDARYRPLIDPTDHDACATCHEGAGARPEGITLTAPGATSCTTCHAESKSAGACSTCHGAPGRDYPPRDPCLFRTVGAQTDPHAAHAAASRSRVDGLECAACHPRPIATADTLAGVLVGTHGDGYVEVWFDHAVSGRDARFDGAAGKRCTGTCHDRGGSDTTPVWRSNANANGSGLTCNSCHASPPPAHFSGPCSSCHREANAAGTALIAPRLHINGKVDVGDGSGRCGGCHGSGDDPWPATGAHPAHASPSSAAPVACETCHVVPGPSDPHPARTGDGVASVRLAGLATRGGSPATYDKATQSCASTYCHAGAGASLEGKAPRWNQGASAIVCGACHSTPPPLPHPQSLTCSASACHEGITSSATAISAGGRAAHVNGRVDRALP